MSLDRVSALWQRARDSLWMIPAVFTVLAVLLALTTVRLDMAGVFDLPEPDDPAAVDPGAMRLLFSGTANGARGVLTAIASGIITVTGVVFSVTIVALQLASTQFTPRILRNFTADRGNQIVLGVFIATFTYALLVLRVVRGEDGTAGDFVPDLSVTVAVLLAVISIGLLIFFIDHAARSVQASVIIDRVTDDTLRTLRRTLPEQIGHAVEDDVEASIPSAQGSVIAATSSGYIQAVDQERLLSLLEEDAYTIRLEPQVGDFVMSGTPLATIWPAGPEEDGSLVKAIRDAFILGHERTPHLDPELGVIELTDIAVKALSTGINDPTTAILCLDRLSEVLVEFGRREPPARVRRGTRGGGILVLRVTDFATVVETALQPIRHYGASSPHFTLSMLRRLQHLGRLLPAHHHPPVARQVAALLRDACGRANDPADRKRLEQAGEDALRALGVGADAATVDA